MDEHIRKQLCHGYRMLPGRVPKTAAHTLVFLPAPSLCEEVGFRSVSIFKLPAHKAL